MKPAIIGIAGPTLTPAEKTLLQTHRPLGVILFARNIETPAQLATLMGDLRGSLPEHPILMVDQEGGRVARLKPPHWRAHPPAQRLKTERAAWLTGALIGLDCAAAGFNLAAAPVLDLADPNGHSVIGDRAFSADPEQAARLGAAFAAGLLAAGIQPCAKHAPGHGRARADSHHERPILDDIAEADLHPFIHNRHLPWMMTAHISYTAQDPENPATLSKHIIQTVIRDRIGFHGALITDDLAMHAITGAPGQRARAALAAGCDVALHCSGILEESENLLDSISEANPACIAAARRMAESARQALDADALEEERKEEVLF